MPSVDKPRLPPHLSSSLLAGEAVLPEYPHNPTISPPFFGPEFVLNLRRLTSGIVPIPVNWSSGHAVFSLPPDEGISHSQRTYTLYILDSDFHLVGFSENEANLPEAIARFQQSLSAEKIELLEAPLVFKRESLSGDDPPPLHERIVVIAQAFGVGAEGIASRKTLGEFEKTIVSFGETRPKQIEAAYLISRYGQREREIVLFPYSDVAMIQAFRRLHPNIPGGRENLIRFTPVVSSPLLALMTGALEVWVKDDSEQYTGSFKPRGAVNKLKFFLEEADPEGLHQKEIAAQTAVVAASHGNHAQGVVWAAGRLGFRETLLVLPLHRQTQKVKIRNCLKLGAMVMLYGQNLAESLQKAQSIQSDGLQFHLSSDIVYLPASATDEELNSAIEGGRTILLFGYPDEPGSAEKGRERAPHFSRKIAFVHTYDDPLVSVGQGTDAMELIGQKPHLLEGAFVYVVPAGGLGKIAGDASYLKEVNPGVRVVGVNRTGVPAFDRSLAQQRYSILPKEYQAPEVDTSADGIDVPLIGRKTFEQANRLNVQSALVTEAEIEEAILFAAHHPWQKVGAKKIEGAPASVLAAVLNGAVRGLKETRLVISVTGRNIDDTRIERLASEKKWVVDDLEFYQFVCRVRSDLRRQLGGEATAWIEVFNELLTEPYFLSALRALYKEPSQETNLFGEILAVLERKIERENYIQSTGRDLISKRKKQKIPISFEAFSHLFYRMLDELANILAAHPDLLVRVENLTIEVPRQKSAERIVEIFCRNFPHREARFPGAMNLAIWMAGQSWIPKRFTSWGIRKTIERMAYRYIAGEDFHSSLKVFLKSLKEGMGIIADMIGEEVQTEEEAEKYLQSYIKLVREMSRNQQFLSATQNLRKGLTPYPLFPEKNRVHAQISLKFSSLTSCWDSKDPQGTAEKVKERLRKLLDEMLLMEATHGVKIGLTVDLEQFEYRELTYQIFQEIFMEDKYRAMENVGIVVQTYYVDSLKILESLAQWSRRRKSKGGGETIFVRLVKGAYHHFEQEEAQRRGYPTPVFPEKWMTDVHFERSVDFVFENSDALRAGVASHNIRSLLYAARRSGETGVPMEAQMLRGIEDQTKRIIVNTVGVPLSVYMPMGSSDSGIQYLVRRLHETSADVSFVRQLNSLEPKVEELLQRPDNTPEKRRGMTIFVDHREAIDADEESSEGIVAEQMPGLEGSTGLLSGTLLSPRPKPTPRLPGLVRI